MAARLPVESSWRMVEGANDSFDTSIVPASFSHSQDSSAGDVGTDTDPFTSSGSVPAAPRSIGLRTSSTGSRPAGGTSSQDDPISLGGGDSFVSGSGSVSGSAAGSQDDDIHTFLRKAENDERVLLRSPFQPSLPSSVRQSPMSAVGSVGGARAPGTADADDARRVDLHRGTYHTPEPELRMPIIGMDGSVHSEGASAVGKGGAGTASLAAAVLRRRGGFFGAGDSGSPLPKRHTLFSRSSTVPSQRDGQAPAAVAWQRPVLLLVLGLVAACAAALVATRTSSKHAPLGISGSDSLFSVSANAVCSIPGVSSFGLAACSAGDSHATTIHDALQQNSRLAEASSSETGPVSLVRSAGDLMRAQIQLAAVVRTSILPSRYKNAAPVADAVDDDSAAAAVPPAHDAWRVPRSRTSGLLVAAQMQQQQTSASDAGSGATLFLLELEAYLDAARRVSAVLSRLQTGAASTAADTLAYSTRRTLAQLRRMDEHIKASRATTDGGEPAASWLSRLLPSAADSYASAGRRRELLADAYRHHASTLLAKTTERVSEAKAVLAELEAARKHLRIVQNYVDARIRGGSSAGSAGSAIASTPAAAPGETGGRFFAWFWKLLGLDSGVDESWAAGDPASSTRRQWTGYAEQLDTLRREHDATVRRAVDALDELADVQDTLARLQQRMGSNSGSNVAADELDLDMRLHMDIVEAGIHDLEAM